MKKFLAFIIIFVNLFSYSFAQERDISVMFNGNMVNFPDQQPILVNSRVLVPVRGVFEAMDAMVDYIPDGDREKVTIAKDDKLIEFEVGTLNVSVTENENTEIKEIDVPTQILNDRTMIPVRFVSETMGYAVEWLDEKSQVKITSQIINSKIQTENRVSIGKNNGMLIKDGGKVFAWGNGEYGQLCGVKESEYPIEISGISNAVAVACGGKSMYVLKEDGTVWSWGNNAGGELGRHTDEKIDAVPKKVEGLENITQISAGYDFALALDKEGNVWSWGVNRCGQLGMGDTQNRTIPEKITEIDEKVVSVAAGSQHSGAVTSSQRVWLWGANDGSQLGKTDKNSMIETPFMLKSITRLTDIAAGGGQTIALRPDGSVYMWGTTYVGQQSEDEKSKDSEEKDETEPIAIVDEDGYCRYLEPQRMRYIYYDRDKEQDFIQILTDATMISCGDYHSVALVNGRIYAWGDSALMPRRLISRNWRFYAQEYTGLNNVVGAYAGKEQDIYALTEDGVIWKISVDGKNEFYKI